MKTSPEVHRAQSLVLPWGGKFLHAQMRQCDAESRLNRFSKICKIIFFTVLDRFTTFELL
jgi:hypothetical protein